MIIPTWKIVLAFIALALVLTLTLAVRHRDAYLPCVKIGGVIPIAGNCHDD